MNDERSSTTASTLRKIHSDAWQNIPLLQYVKAFIATSKYFLVRALYRDIYGTLTCRVALVRGLFLLKQSKTMSLLGNTCPRWLQLPVNWCQNRWKVEFGPFRWFDDTDDYGKFRQHIISYSRLIVIRLSSLWRCWQQTFYKVMLFPPLSIVTWPHWPVGSTFGVLYWCSAVIPVQYNTMCFVVIAVCKSGAVCFTNLLSLHR